MKRRKLKNHIHSWGGGGLKDYAADIQRLAKEAYPSMDPKLVEGAAVDSFVDEIWDWEVPSLVVCRSAKNITVPLSYALELPVGVNSSGKFVIFLEAKGKIKKVVKSLPKEMTWQTFLDSPSFFFLFPGR